MASPNQFIKKAYLRLYRRFGPQHWWPGDTPFEIIIGAILTQNTNWGNVEKAIINLKKANLLTPMALHKASKSTIAKHIRPAGYFNLKAERLKNFIEFLYDKYGGRIKAMQKEPLEALRENLLNVHGIGPETADSILLYACERPTFVIDAYTKRVLYRHNVINEKAAYQDVKKLFEDAMNKDVQTYNEYHALIVRLGKDYCKPKAKCSECPLNSLHYSTNNYCGTCYRSFLVRENADNNSQQLCSVCDTKQ